MSAFTRRSLELDEPFAVDGRGTTLLQVVDRTVTAAGGRLLRQRLAAPLVDAGAIAARLDEVAFFARRPRAMQAVRQALRQASDLERALQRVRLRRASPRDVRHVVDTLAAAAELHDALVAAMASDATRAIVGADDARDADQLPLFVAAHELRFDALRRRLDAAVADDAPSAAKDGGIIRVGYDAELGKAASGARDAATPG